MLDDSKLVELTIGGDADAFAQLVRKYQGPLIASAYHFVGNVEDAQDLAQDTLIAAYKRLSLLREGAKLKGWLFAILRNNCLRFIQHHRPHEVPLDLCEGVLATPAPVSDQDLLESINCLPLADREVLVARYLQELSFEEIAELLDTSVNAVQMRCSRARQRLRQRLQVEEEETRTLMRRTMGIIMVGGISDSFVQRVMTEVTPMTHVSSAALLPAPPRISLLRLPARFGWHLAAGVAALVVAGVGMLISQRVHISMLAGSLLPPVRMAAVAPLSPATPLANASAVSTAPQRTHPSAKHTAKAPLLLAAATADDKPTRLLLQWESQQQMNWDIRIHTAGVRFSTVSSFAHDNGETQHAVISPDGTALTIESVTGWSTGSVLVDIARAGQETINVEIRDPYVKDRFTKDQFTLAEILHGRSIRVTSKEWPIRNCLLRLSTDPTEVAQETELLKALGKDRKRNVDALLAFAGFADDKARRLQLLWRAAASCSGGCNHGPLGADGWDRAIAIYQKIIDEHKDTDAALNALWAQASCYACVSPAADCDQYGRGKGDWKAARTLYAKLYQISRAPSDKADALRRMAEIQCFEANDWDAGLNNYRKIAEEFTTALPPSTHWTYRTCAPACGTERLAWDIYRAIVHNAPSKRAVQTIFDEKFGAVHGNPQIDELRQYVFGT